MQCLLYVADLSGMWDETRDRRASRPTPALCLPFHVDAVARLLKVGQQTVHDINVFFEMSLLMTNFDNHCRFYVFPIRRKLIFQKHLKFNMEKLTMLNQKEGVIRTPEILSRNINTIQLGCWNPG